MAQFSWPPESTQGLHTMVRNEGSQLGPPADMGNTSAGAVLPLAWFWCLLILGNKNYKLITSVSRCELDFWSR